MNQNLITLVTRYAHLNPTLLHLDYRTKIKVKINRTPGELEKGRIGFL